MSPMTLAATCAPAPATQETLAELLAHIRARRDDYTALRHVPPALVARLKQQGVYRAATPQRFGGSGMAPADFLQLIARIAEADASVGWVASFGSAGLYLAALPPATQALLYKDTPDLVFAGGLFPIQPAVPVEGGWNVTGTWKFASGCKGADMLGVGIGTAAATPGARPRTAVLPPSRVDIVENWDVMGLCGTGSHDLRVHAQFVADDWTFVRGGTPTIDEPLYRYPSIAYAAQVLGVVNLGVARAAIDELNGMAGGRVAITGAPRLADRAYVRTAVALAEAQLRSTSAFLYDTSDAVWQAILAGDPVTPEQVSLLRLTAVEAARVGYEVAHSMFSLAGITAVYASHPLQRYLRDAAVVKQHAFLSDGIYDGAGAVALGVAPMPGYL